MTIARLILCVIVGITGINGKPPKLIVGGTDAHEGEFPYQVALSVWSQHCCGGSIIGSRHILTAAHCVNDPRFDVKEDMRVLAGTNNIMLENGTSYRIESFKIHPLYSPSNLWKNDIAVLTLSTEIKFDRLKQAVKLPWRYTGGYLRANASGWGDTSYPGGSTPIILKKMEMRTIANEECILPKNKRIHDSQLCALDKRGSGLCTGDSGGGLVSRDVVVGIASFVYPCGLGYPDIFTRVYTYVDWIKSVMHES